MNSTNTRNILWPDLFCLFTFSFALRVVLIFRNPDLYAFDAYIYLLGLSSEYPLFTGLVKLMIWSDFSVFAIRIVTAGFASFACIAFYLFARCLFSDAIISRSAAVLMSIYPSFLTFSVTPYTESLFFLVFFYGLWFFEKENDTLYYPGTGIFLGLACLVRYEAWFILPLIFVKIIVHQKKRNQDAQRISLFRLLGICLSLFWGPMLVLLYKYVLLPERIARQSGGIQEIVTNLFPLLNSLLHSAWSKLLPDILARGLLFPLIVFFLGLIIASAGCISSAIQDKNKHLPYMFFIILAMGIQLLPVILNYQHFGRIIGLRRHGMVPLVFLLLYLPYGIDLLIKKFVMINQFFSKKTGFCILNKKKWQTVAFIILLSVFAGASFKATDFLLSDFRKLYRNSYIQPYWIGKPGDAGAGIIASTSDKTIIAHLLGKPLKVYQPPNFAGMPPEKIQEFIEQKRIRYVILDRDSFPAFDRFLKKRTRIEFRQLARVSNWLFVYVLI